MRKIGWIIGAALICGAPTAAFAQTTTSAFSVQQMDGGSIAAAHQTGLQQVAVWQAEQETAIQNALQATPPPVGRMGAKNAAAYPAPANCAEPKPDAAQSAAIDLSKEVAAYCIAPASAPTR